MKKRGQVTTFMIVGFVILILVVLIFSLRRAGVGMTSNEYLQTNLEDVKTVINDCIDKETLSVVDLIGKQGGYLNPTSYRMYNGYKVAYLCGNIPDTDLCMNQMVSQTQIENELANNLKLNLPYCVNIDQLSKRLFFPEISVGDLDVKTTIDKEAIVYEINYPITLKKGDSKVELTTYKKSVNVPLGKLLDTTYDIVNSEATNGVFFDVPYMLANRGRVEIFKDQPYPDKIYKLNVRDSNYIFQFAIQNEGENE
ncbi:MAG: hypothetical protein PHF86_05805 [Candidatus Nanoarchaeia archaeon]|nr:hypothetical protein [Candidatus Nanoarchaeia archaeon]